MMRAGPKEQMPAGLRWMDDRWGVTWRLTNLLRRASLRGTVAFTRAFVAPVRHEAPIFVLGVPRSGTTVIFRLLAANRSLGSLPREGHDMWRAFHHPRYTGWESDAVGAGRVRRGERRFIDAYLTAHFRERRFVEKTPENSLRVPYLLDLFPDARFVVVWRDPLEVVSSLVDGWRHPAGRFRSYYVPESLSIPGYPHRHRWCFALIEGWRELRSSAIPEIAYRQWAAMSDALLRARDQVAPEQWSEVRLEDFLGDPRPILQRLSNRLDLGSDSEMQERLDALMERPVNAMTSDEHGKRQRLLTHREVAPLIPRMRPTAERIGYELPGSDSLEGVE